jgi:hypothetical protein
MKSDDYGMDRLAMNLVAVNRELIRLSQLCRVRLLQPGVAERILRRDASVCGANNAIAFGKLHGLLVMHFTMLARLAAD